MKKQKINRWTLKLACFVIVFFLLPILVWAKSYIQNYDVGTIKVTNTQFVTDENIVKIKSKISRKMSGNANLTNQRNGSKLKFVPDEIIIKLKSEPHGKMSITINGNKNVVTGLASMDKLNKKFGASKMKQILKKRIKPAKRKLSLKAKQLRQNLLRLYKIKLKPGTNIIEAISEYQKDQNIEYAEPNYIYRINSTMPNDIKFDQLWGLHNTGQTSGTVDADIDALEACAYSGDFEHQFRKMLNSDSGFH